MLSELFDAIRPHLDRIDFTINFHDVIKIYHWTNPYLHAGLRDFVWVPLDGFIIIDQGPIIKAESELSSITD